VRPRRGRGDDADARALLHGVAMADDVVEAEAPPLGRDLRRRAAGDVRVDPLLGIPRALRAAHPARRLHLCAAAVDPFLPVRSPRRAFRSWLRLSPRHAKSAASLQREYRRRAAAALLLPR